MIDYWSTIAGNNTLYQMGSYSHRLYILDVFGGNRKINNEYLQVKSLLDVGCGTAPIYQLLDMDRKKPDSKWNAIEKYRGVDPSPTMIETCRFHFPEGDFAVAHAEKLDEENASWDALLYMHSFDYMYHYQQAIEEMYRVTKKYIAIILWQKLENGNDHRLNNSVNGIEPVDWDTARLQHFSWPTLQKELEASGFKILLKKDDEEINKEKRNNTVILLEKI